MNTPRGLRAVFFAAIALVAFLVLRGVEEGGTLTLAPGDDAVLADALVSDRPPARIVWSGGRPPGGAASMLLSAGPAVPPLTLPVGRPPSLRVTPPVRPVAGRASALDVAVEGAPEGDTVVVAWRDELGGTDSVGPVADADGRVRVGLRVRPARSGWHEWTVLAGTDSARAGAWVLPERPVRVLALAGAPDWEARFVLRALDESGVEVDARFDLGRVEIGPPERELEAYDVVLLLGGGGAESGAAEAPRIGGRTDVNESDAAAPTGLASRLVAFVRGGGGLVVAAASERAGGDQAGERAASDQVGGRAGGDQVGVLLRSLDLATGVSSGPTLEENATLRWALPAELTPLPPAPVRAATLALVDPDPAAAMAHAPDGTPLVAARPHGRGRAAVLGIAETWRWRMEAGAVDAHRAWWRGWVEWAASGLRDLVVVRAAEQPAWAGAVVRLRVEALDPAASLPSALRLERPGGIPGGVADRPGGAIERPGGAIDSLPVMDSLPVTVLGPGLGEARFLADRAGPYRVSWQGEETGVEAVAEPPAPEPDEVALLAVSSGRPGSPGTPMPAAGPRVGNSWRGGQRSGPPPLLGVLLVVLALSEWTLRRARGGP